LDAAVYLVSIGSGRFELYTEPPDDTASAATMPAQDGFIQRIRHRLHEWWRHAAHAAAHGSGPGPARFGRIARARDWLVRRIAESIAEQRVLWSLRGMTAAAFVYPSNLSDATAVAAREALLAQARRHHGRWLLANIVGVALTAVLVLLPGPNVIGYYFAFRVVGHYLSWRGARHGLERIAWSASAEPALTDLAALADLPRDERAERVALLAAALRLPQLAVFFDRVAVPSR
jgi:hypothetical protein